MSLINYSNFIETTIANVGGISGVATSVTVASAAGFPTPPFIARATQYDADGLVTAYEFWRVTAWSGTGNVIWTITRAQESTTGIAHAAGTRVTNPVTAGVLSEGFVRQDAETYYDIVNSRLAVGSGGLLPSYRLTVGGSEANNTLGSGVKARTHIFNSEVNAVGRLAELTFGASINSSYAGVAGFLQSAAGSTAGGIIFSIRKLIGDTNLTEIARFEQATGQFLLPLGTAALPQFAFSGDPDTGLYSPGANILAAVVNGIERMRWYAAANGAAVRVGNTGSLPALLDQGTELIIATGTTGGGLRSTINRYGWDVANGGVLVTDVYNNNVSGTTYRVGQLDMVIEGAGKDGAHWNFHTRAPGDAGTTGTVRLIIGSSGAITPGGNKTQDLGSTGARWNNIYYAAATTGTSRLCDSVNDCPSCQKPMKRGTGTHILLGETEDYVQTFCPGCGHVGFETLSKLPKFALSQRNEAPVIQFDGIVVQPVSGNSYLVKVDFIYNQPDKDEEFVRNSTILGQTEVDHFFALPDFSERRAYLLELGQREWYAMEEARLMKEEAFRVQQRFDDAIQPIIGMNLLTGSRS